MSEQNIALVLSFSAERKVAFLVFLYGRMIPELRSFCHAENRDFSLFQKAQEEFWRWINGSTPSISWRQFREDILNAAPDTEDFGTLAGSFALNTTLVAANIAGFIADGKDCNIVEAISCARDSLDAFATNELGTVVFNRTNEDDVQIHPLVQREARIEEEDVIFLSHIQEPPWPETVLLALRRRAEGQRGLLSQ